MTEAEASDRLEQAVRDWARVTYPDDPEIVKSWVLLTETLPVNEPDATAVLITASDGLSLVGQMGLIEYARTICHQASREP